MSIDPTPSAGLPSARCQLDDTRFQFPHPAPMSGGKTHRRSRRRRDPPDEGQAVAGVFDRPIYIKS